MMSNFISKARHPETDAIHDVEMIDDYYGRHVYGVRFPDGKTYKEEEVDFV